MKHDESVYIRHILDSISKIEEYVTGIDESSFFKTTLIQDGVIRQLQIIGEAVKKLSEELRDEYSHVPWQDIAAMRDKLIHDYFGVNMEEVWLTVKDDLPELKSEIVKIDNNVATIDVDGVKREASLVLLENPEVGDYVIVHAGFAINKINEEDVLESLKLLREAAALIFNNDKQK